jgi:hypothetical protein
VVGVRRAKRTVPLRIIPREAGAPTCLSKRVDIHSNLVEVIGLLIETERRTGERDYLRTLRSILYVVALLFVLAGCQALTGETLGEQIDDTTITTTVKAKLAQEKGTTLTRVQVDANRGVVQLSGVVEAAGDRSRAAQIAGGVGGVKSVVNNLQVQR